VTQRSERGRRDEQYDVGRERGRGEGGKGGQVADGEVSTTWAKAPKESSHATVTINVACGVRNPAVAAKANQKTSGCSENKPYSADKVHFQRGKEANGRTTQARR
jgi:hypothetical protein